MGKYAPPSIDDTGEHTLKRLKPNTESSGVRFLPLPDTLPFDESPLATSSLLSQLMPSNQTIHFCWYENNCASDSLLLIRLGAYNLRQHHMTISYT